MGYTAPPTKKFPDGAPWDKGFTSAQHQFMDREMATIVDQLNLNNVGGRNNWDSSSAQAAAWTGAKIRSGDIGIEDAASHYGSFSPKYQAAGTFEQAPYSQGGHLEGYQNLSRPVRSMHEGSPLSGMTNNMNQDRLYSDIGYMVEPTTEAKGYWMPQGADIPEFNQAYVSRPLVTTREVPKLDADGNPMFNSTGSALTDKGGIVVPSDAAILNQVEGSRAYVNYQGAGAWNKIIPDTQTRMGERSSIRVEMDRAATNDELARINEIATQNGMFAVDTGSGINIINDKFTDIGANRTGVTLGQELKGDMGRQIKEIFGKNVVRGKIETGYLDYENLWKSGEGATAKFLDDLDSNPKIRDAMEPALKDAARFNLQKDADLARTSGLPVRDDVQEARRILSEEGINGLREAIEKGVILPAVGLGILAPKVLFDDSQTEMTELQ